MSKEGSMYEKREHATAKKSLTERSLPNNFDHLKGIQSWSRNWNRPVKTIPKLLNVGLGSLRRRILLSLRHRPPDPAGEGGHRLVALRYGITARLDDDVDPPLRVLLLLHLLLGLPEPDLLLKIQTPSKVTGAHALG